MSWSAQRILVHWAIAFGLGCGPQGPVLTLNPTGGEGGRGDGTSPIDDATVGNPADGTTDHGSLGSGDSTGGDLAAANAPDAGQDASAGAEDAEIEAGMDAGTTGCGQRPPLPPDASPARTLGCSFSDGGTQFPLLDKCCLTNDDCTLGLYENVCCGNRFALGFNKSQAPAFHAALAQWTCAQCACPGAPGPYVEEGEGGALDAGVRCDNGWCMTYAP
jgi:hypothetical protein